MLFDSVYLVEGLFALYPLEQEGKAVAKGGCLVSTQKDYQSAWDIVAALAQEKQLLLADCQASDRDELKREGFNASNHTA